MKTLSASTNLVPGAIRSAGRYAAAALVCLWMLNLPGFVPAARGETYAVKLLHSFAPVSTEGSNPYGALVRGTDGNFYGTTYDGGSGAKGTVFRLTSAGVLTTLHDFAGSDGAFVQGALI